MWDPVFQVDKARIESVQKQFLLFALRRLNWSDRYVLPPYEARLALLSMESLAERRTMITSSFTASCIMGDVKCERLNDMFTFEEPTRTTRATVSSNGDPIRRLRLQPMARSLYIDNAPIRRCIKTFNLYTHLLDDSVPGFRRRLRGELVMNRRPSSGR